MRKSILEYNENKIEINVPEYIYLISDMMEKLAGVTKDAKDFRHAYNFLQEYYEGIANKLFNEKGLWMDGFHLHKEDIVDYCKFVKI